MIDIKTLSINKTHTLNISLNEKKYFLDLLDDQINITNYYISTNKDDEKRQDKLVSYLNEMIYLKKSCTEDVDICLSELDIYYIFEMFRGILVGLEEEHPYDKEKIINSNKELHTFIKRLYNYSNNFINLRNRAS